MVSDLTVTPRAGDSSHLQYAIRNTSTYPSTQDLESHFVYIWASSLAYSNLVSGSVRWPWNGANLYIEDVRFGILGSNIHHSYVDN